MSEEKKQEEEQAPEGVGGGDKPKEASPIDDTNLAAKRMEDATKAMREENDRTENNYAKMKLGGGSEAGGKAEEPKKDTDAEYADKFLKGEVDPLEDDGLK